MVAQSRTPTLVFAALSLAVYATAITLAGLLRAIDRTGIVAVAMSLDLVVFVPAAFYFLIVRPRRWPVVALAPIVVVSLGAATLIVPADQQQALRILEALVVPLEAVLIGSVLWKAAKDISTRAR